MIDIVDFAFAILQIMQHFYDRENILLSQHSNLIVGFLIQARIHFHPPNRRQIISFAVEKQTVEHRFRRFQRGRFTRTHHSIDVDQCVGARFILIRIQRASNIRANIDVIDGQKRHFLNAELGQFFKGFLNQFGARFIQDLP